MINLAKKNMKMANSDFFMVKSLIDINTCNPDQVETIISLIKKFKFEAIIDN
jgi:hypothetical protein